MPTQPTQPQRPNPTQPPQQRPAAPQQPPQPQSQPKPAAQPPKPDADKDKKAEKAAHEADERRDHPQPIKTPVAGVAPPEPGLALGARPHDKRDPQSAKFEAHAGPPYWLDPKAEPKPREEWTPNPALDAREQKPPVGYYADGMSAPDEQRARAAWVEAHGVKEYDEATDQRPAEDKPTFDPHALAGGGAFVKAGKQRQVPGVVPPTKRE